MIRFCLGPGLRTTLAFGLLLLAGHSHPNAFCLAQDVIRIGSKNMTESVILGEMLCASPSATPGPGETPPARVKHLSELGGTQIVWKALKKGEIDAYVEYSGTMRFEILSDDNPTSLEQIVALVDREGIGVCEPLGFNNTYALGMRRERAGALGIRTISDLRQHPNLKLGFSDEFMKRSDGWSGLATVYKLPEFTSRALDHSLAYRGLVAGSIDVIDLYSTDPEIISYDLLILDDDLQHFPRYEAAIVFRKEMAEKHPSIIEAFKRLSGKIDNSTMIHMNADSRLKHLPENKIAIDFLHDSIDANLVLADVSAGRWERRLSDFVKHSLQHLTLVGVSLALAIAVSIPLGILAYKLPNLGNGILGVVGIIQTIPSMALLVFMIPLLGLGAVPAIVALFLYSLLPIVRGTYTGLSTLPESIHESALALGLPDGARLRLIELPMASQQILSGIKTSAVINVGTATIGALIGAGGYGQPILAGIRLSDIGLILEGAVPAALLALLVQGLFTWLERYLVPKGLRLRS